jgi:hypothetical protein
VLTYFGLGGYNIYIKHIFATKIPIMRTNSFFLLCILVASLMSCSSSTEDLDVDYEDSAINRAAIIIGTWQLSEQTQNGDSVMLNECNKSGTITFDGEQVTTTTYKFNPNTEDCNLNNTKSLLYEFEADDALVFIENQYESQIEIGIINDSVLSLIEEGYTSSGELIRFETTFNK